MKLLTCSLTQGHFVSILQRELSHLFLTNGMLLRMRNLFSVLLPVKKHLT